MFGVAIAFVSIGAPAMGHTDPTEMGAGPGTPAPDHHNKSGENASRNAETRQMMDSERGSTMPIMPNGSAPTKAGDNHMAGINYSKMGQSKMDHSKMPIMKPSAESQPESDPSTKEPQ